MAVLESCPKHNMVAYLEKTDGNTEFHEIISFLTRSSIHYALTVSPVVSTTFVEQFWMSAKSKIINNVRYITAKVAGKPVSISEASIRSDLLFDDADGIDSLPNQAIFDAIQLMGILGYTAKECACALRPFPINALTSKVFSFMVKKGKHFSGNVTPLFDYMLVQPTKDEGDTLERQSEPQPIPSPPHPDQHETQTDPSPRPSPTTHIPDSIPEGSGGNHRSQSSSDRSLSGNKDGLTLQSVYDLCVSLCKQVTDQAKEIKHLKAQIKKLKKKAKRGRKPAKAEPIVHKDPAFDDLDDIVDDAIDYMESEDAQDEGRTSSVVLEEKESTQKGVITEVEVSTVKPDEGTDKSKVSIDKPEVSTAQMKEVEVSTDKLDEGTVELKDGTLDESTALTTVFRDDETIAEFLYFTLRALPKIDPKDKGKKVLEEEAESEGVDEAERRLISSDRLLAEGFKEEERESFTVERKPNFFMTLIAAQKEVPCSSKSCCIHEARHNKESQLRKNPMMTYLKHVGGKKHADLKNKNFEEIQVLYKNIKRSDNDFIAIGFAEDERQIKEMNENLKDPKKKRVVNELQGKKDIAKDLFHLYDLVMKQYSEITPEGIELILWGGGRGTLGKTMMESQTEENDQGDFGTITRIGRL
ncbi:hypothetical protein Tco_1538005 [Tanacetum coccineum]